MEPKAVLPSWPVSDRAPRQWFLPAGSAKPIHRAPSLPPLSRAASEVSNPSLPGIPAPKNPTDDLCVAAWRHVLAKLKSEARHRNFVATCIREQRLDFALESYRALVQLRPHDREAKQRFERVVELVKLQLPSAGAKRSAPRYSRSLKVIFLSVFGLLSMISLYGIISYARQLSRTPPALTQPR